MNQGWTLPGRAWVPRKGVRPAPLEWQFWRTTLGFEELVSQAKRPHNRRMAWGLVLIVLGLVLSTSALGFLLLSALGLWRLVSGAIGRSSLRRTAMEAVRRDSVRVREEVLNALYEDYLNETHRQ